MVTRHFLKKIQSNFGCVQKEGKRSGELGKGWELKEAARSSSPPLDGPESNQETATNCFIKIKLLQLHANYFPVAV